METKYNSLQLEIISAKEYYGRHTTGWVVVVNGQPHHEGTRTDAKQFAESILKLWETYSMTYKIIRVYATRWPRVIRSGLSLEEVQAHMKDPEYDSRTSKKPWNKQRTKKFGEWFDTYAKETNTTEPKHEYFQ